MMALRIGISTANLYPLNIEDTFAYLEGQGARDAEIFVNTDCEVSKKFAALLKTRANAAGLNIRALHSYTSCFEPYMLFSQYERRFEDGLKLFVPIFRAAQIAGAEFVVLHGDRDPGVLPAAQSIRRFERLYDLGREYGVTLLQENVVRFRACRPEFIREMRDQLGDKAQFVLDFKQCRRTGIPIPEMIDAMRGAIRHVHISDCSDTEDCLMPGAGQENFPYLLQLLKDSGFDGTLTIELYRRNFDKISELSKGCAALAGAIAEISR